MDRVRGIRHLALQFLVRLPELRVILHQPRRHFAQNAVEIELVPGRVHDDLRRRDAMDAERAVEGTPIEDVVDRAQPGDVLGIESGGEITSIGDTAQDEDRRREDAEKDNREILEKQRRDRGSAG